MAEIDALVTAYTRHVAIPWEPRLAGPQRVWFVVHEPRQERQVRAALERFQQATELGGHGWVEIDLAGQFGAWLATQRYRTAYFREPGALTDRLGDFGTWLADQLKPRLANAADPDGTVVALVGASSLFGLTSVSALEEALAPAIRGRLLVFFPGERIGSSYRFMGAGDGWNYLAIPITATDGV